MVNTAVPVTAPNAVLSTAIVKALAEVTITDQTPLRAAQLPVYPVILTTGVLVGPRVTKSPNPCAVAVKLTGLALEAADTVMVEGGLVEALFPGW